MAHLALPQRMTPENLAQWITTNSVEERTHEEKIDLTSDEIQVFEHDSSVASRAIDRLDDLKEKFVTHLKEGTQDPIDFTIPPTKGLKVLQENREFADKQIEQGYRTEITELYFIPYPETRKLICVDATGEHWENYDMKMNPPQIQKYAKPLLEQDEETVSPKIKKVKESIPGFEAVAAGTESDGTPSITFKKKEKVVFTPPASLPFEPAE